MKISLFYEMQISQPTRSSEQDLFKNCLEQGVLADKLGYHCLWNVEHHGLREYAHSSAPEIFLSFLAAKTKNIRLGHGVTLTARGYNHPIRVAERVALLDVLSGGRVNWGSGKSSSNVEARLFEIAPDTLDELWREAIEMIPSMWKDGPFSWKSKNYNIPECSILPKPMQTPHPPIFGPSAHPASLQAIGDMGIGALCFSHANADDLRNKVQIYRKAVEAANPSGYQKNNHFAVTANTCVLEDDDMACRFGMTGARYFRDAFAKYYNQPDAPTFDKLGVNYEQLDGIELKLAKGMRRNPETELWSIIGDPGLAREKVEIYRECGVDELILIMQLGTVPHEIICDSLITFAEQVMHH
ncbi:MAG: LLM class flavin-dependent oxidoreductase [Alphaproteobacteria bacterium]|nr:LLM class flavin-dependent oxidoreductase [Alphaproteobacteria bacterium]